MAERSPENLRFDIPSFSRLGASLRYLFRCNS
jgi:hypothetical protein